MAEEPLRLYLDADVLFAGAARSSETAASYTLLLLGEVGLIEAIVCTQAVEEAGRNLAKKAPVVVPTFRRIVERSVRVVPDPPPAAVTACTGLADPKDLPHLVAALENGCRWLVSFNERDFQPGHPDVTVVAPGQMIRRLRAHLAGMTRPEPRAQ
jgi:predicted nucleic acid-binding protein